MGMPRVIVVRNASTRRKKQTVPCTRRNLLVRDNATCQYCGHVVRTSEYTIDHITPVCQGGKSTWDNLAIACMPCNKEKGGRTPAQAGMALLSKPYTPKPTDPRFNFKLHVHKMRPGADERRSESEGQWRAEATLVWNWKTGVCSSLDYYFIFARPEHGASSLFSRWPRAPQRVHRAIV